MSVLDEGYFKEMSCALSQISTLFLLWQRPIGSHDSNITFHGRDRKGKKDINWKLSKLPFRTKEKTHKYYVNKYKKSLEILKGYLESFNRRQTNNNGQAKKDKPINKALHIKLKIE